MKISNSQIASMQKCKKRFYFEHILRIKPLTFPEAMEKGIAGHTMLEEFLIHMAKGESYEDCMNAVNALLPGIMAEQYGMEKTKVYRLVLAFGARAFQERWKPVAVEENFKYETGEHEFVFTPDVIFEWTVGPKKGKRFMLDFKFTGQYWSEREIGVYQQLPKYTLYYNKMHEKKISHAAVVMLNTRASQGATGNDLFKINWLDLSKKKLATIERENEDLMAEVATLRNDPEGTGFHRSVDSYTCKLCFFADDLCPMDLAGQDLTRTIERNYEYNTYFEDNYESN